MADGAGDEVADAHVSPTTAHARVLSYNFNILPRGCGGYQHERIETFLNTVDQYDVILLQEVHAITVLPYCCQKWVCFQNLLLGGLKEKGFHHYVISRQPSYSTMLWRNIISDNGLIIASRFPIWHRGTYTFRSHELQEQPVAKGCLFAEIELPPATRGDGEGRRVVFFNVHLAPQESFSADPSQVQQMCLFVESVLQQLRSKDSRPLGHAASDSCPFVIAGDFNIHGIDTNTRLQSKSFIDFINEVQSIGPLQDVLLSAVGHNPPTRPPKLFFPTRSKLEHYVSVPQRQDYFLTDPRVKATHARLEKFIVSSRRPYTYLSDHFGISATVEVDVQAVPSPPKQQRTSRLTISPLVEEALHEQSNPTPNSRMEAFFFFLVLWIACTTGVKPILLCLLGWALAWWSQYNIVPLPDERQAPLVTQAVKEGKAEVPSPKNIDNSLSSVQTVADMWERAVTRFRSLRCLGAADEQGKPVWLSYGAVDARVREFGAGLRQLGVLPGDTLGVECEPCQNAVVLELACALYGYTTLPLAGKANTVRTLLDQHKVRLAVAGRSAVVTLLTCRSTALETIIYLHPFADEDDQAAAKDLNINLVSFDAVAQQGVLLPAAVAPRPTPTTRFTLTTDNVGTKDCTALVPVTHADVLRDINVLIDTCVLPSRFQQDSMLWFTPFASLFSRLCVLGLFANGNAVGTISSTRLQEAFAKFEPTILVTSPSLFASSSLQLSRAKLRYSALYNWMFDRAYQIRSRLIHLHNRDSNVLRFLFFRSFQSQLGGMVRRIVLTVSQETTAFYLVEHISVCYAPCLREVSYQNCVGVCTVDGIPAPSLRIELKPMDELSEKANIGQLALTRAGGKQLNLEIAARWERDSRLTLLGSSLGILWPVDYQFAISVELERLFANSRYVHDIFVYCAPLHPIIAVVCPNRDVVEFEWLLSREPGQSKQLGWTELVEYAAGIILEDLASIAREHRLHHSQIPAHVHLHPHAFRDHSTFLTPFGKIRTENVRRYFAEVFKRVYNQNSLSLETLDSWENVSDADSLSMRQENAKHLYLQVPVTIDIGGTFAKIAFIMPPGMRSLPNPPSIIREASSLSETLGQRTFRFFADEAAAQKELQENPHSGVGTLRFAKIPSKDIPRFIEYLAAVHATRLFKPVYMQKIRATGGGAFKYAALAHRAVGVDFSIVKEMNAVVMGLNLIISLAPESIFTVNPTTGEHLPHRLHSPGEAALAPFPYLLVNIGSGISFIKCLGPDGSHVRVGGTPIGGATFWGLTRTMTSLTSWEEVMEIMRLDGPGDNKNVDLLVGDIYGFNAKDLPAMLSSETVASSFGKFGTERHHEAGRGSPEHFAGDDAREIFSPLSSPKATTISFPTRAASTASSIDIVRSLLNMIAGNVTQLAYLHSQVHGIKNIFFAGGFVRNNPMIWSIITSTLHYWSSGECYAHFLEHDGYLGTLGSAIVDPAGDLPMAPS